ncbi:MAG: transglutaminase family protein [Alphaproteobacteria bacterium]|nr:transglutaminase family protein [Alphaproteobacteria bacterium]
MRIHFGCELQLVCDQPTPVTLLMTVRPERRRRLITPDRVALRGGTTRKEFIDAFGNLATRAVLAAGRRHVLRVDGIIRDGGKPDPVRPSARQVPIAAIPDEVMPYLMSSRYCEVDLLSDFAWKRFAATPPGWPRVQAICDFVHRHVAFGYPHARATRSAAQALQEKVGVCRDFAHLAVALCRAMGIPARYTTGYLGDIGVPPAPCPMDFSAWFEAWLEGGWFAFDARHNTPRIGRIPIAHGRDATDVAFVTSFGAHRMLGFKVWTDELAEERRPPRTTRKASRRAGTACAPVQAANA